MAKNTLPPIVLQTIEALTDKSVPEHIKFNYLRSLENIRDECTRAIDAYNKKTAKVKM